jgi:hypothetical protein
MTETEKALREIIARHVVRAYEAGYQAALTKARNIITADITHTDKARRESEARGDDDSVDRLGVMSDYLSFLRLSICGPAEQEKE